MSDNSSFDPEFASPSDYAYLYRNLGLQVVPAKTPNEDPKQWKRPALSKWKELENTLASDETFDGWYGERGMHKNRYNMGLITGACSDRIFVVDLDTHKSQAAQAWWDGIIHSQQKAGELETVEQLTGGGGTQLFFRAPTDWIPPTCKTSIGVDIRGQGGFAMLPPSIHESGNAYDWKDGHEPWTMGIVDAPPWFCDEIDQLTQEYGGHTSSSGPRQRTSSSDQETDAFGRRINGREDYMTRLVWARVVEEYRQCEIHPAKADIEDIIRETFAIPVWSIDPAIDADRPAAGRSGQDAVDRNFARRDDLVPSGQAGQKHQGPHSPSGARSEGYPRHPAPPHRHGPHLHHQWANSRERLLQDQGAPRRHNIWR